MRSPSFGPPTRPTPISCATATIAAEHGITVKVLLALNPDIAAAAVVYVGQSLRVPGPLDLEAVPDVTCSAEYTAREGDTWISIGEAHAVDAGTLAHVNRGDANVEPAAGMRLCLPVVPVAVPEASATPPAPRMECEDEIRYILQGEDPAVFNYTDEALVPGSQVCVLAALGSGPRALLRVSTETGVTGWISSRHVGNWSAYLASTDPSLATPTATPRPMRTPRPTATPRPTRTPTPVATPTPTAVPCREAWGASAVAYRVRTGPGTQHAHTGRYVAAGEPVCELRREQGWVQVRLADGATGWVHADGITNRQPASTPVPAPTATPGPAASAAPTPIPAVHTSSGIVNVTHEYTATFDLSLVADAGLTHLQRWHGLLAIGSPILLWPEWEALRAKEGNMVNATTFKFIVNDTQFESAYEKVTGLEILEMAAERGAIGGKPEDYILQSLDADDRQYKPDDTVDLSVDHQFITLPSGPTPVARA